MTSGSVRVGEIDWTAWRPRDRATLVFVVQGGEVLLIRKLRGLGAGKVNAPGGRLAPDETPLQCAVREVREEVCVTPLAPELRGELSFQFVDGYSIHAYVFLATGCEGEPGPTEEAIPFWVPPQRIPYGEMWADDRLWVPRLLDGECFRGRFCFDGDRMLSHELEVCEARACDAASP